MAVKQIPADLAFLCGVLSPFTGTEEVDRLRLIARRAEVSWEGVASYANRHNLAPALNYSLREKGLSEFIPPLLLDYLEEMHRFNRQRNEALRRQSIEVVGLLNGAGIIPLLLKGGAALATDLFPDPGMRFMWDLDLLVPPGTMERSVAALKSTGYAVPEGYASAAVDVSDHAGLHHHPPLIRSDSAAPVELHRRVLSKAYGDLLPVEAVWRESRPYTGDRLPGVSAVLMAPTQELIHSFVHSQLAHDGHRYGSLDLRQLHQFAYLCRRGGIDGEKAIAFLQEKSLEDIFNDFACQAKLLFQIELPFPIGFGRRAERRFLRIVTPQPGWKKKKKVSGLMVKDLFRAFSRERLTFCYGPQERIPMHRLRLQHLRFLLRKYCRAGAWKDKWRRVAKS